MRSYGRDILNRYGWFRLIRVGSTLQRVKAEVLRTAARRVLLVVGVLCTAVPAWSQAAGTVTVSVDEAVEAALRANVGLQRSALDVDTQRVTVENLWSLFLPGFTVRAGAGYSRAFVLADASNAAERARPAAEPWSITSGVSASLQLNAGIPHAIAAARLAHGQALYAQQTERLALATEVRKLFWALLNARRQLEVHEGNSALAEAQLAGTRARFAGGLVSERVVLQAQFALENARFAAERARLDYSLQVRTLADRMGLGNVAVIEPVGEMAVEPLVLDADELIERYIERVAAVVNARTAVERQRVAAAAAGASARGPSVGLSAGWSGSHLDGFTDSVSAGATVTVPVDGWIRNSRSHQAVESARRELRKAELAVEQALRAAELAVRRHVVTLDQALASVRIAELQVEIARRSYELAEAGFAQGFVERLEFEQRRTDLLDAQLRVLAGQHQYRAALIDVAALFSFEDFEELRR